MNEKQPRQVREHVPRWPMHAINRGRFNARRHHNELRVNRVFAHFFLPIGDVSVFTRRGGSRGPSLTARELIAALPLAAANQKKACCGL